MSKHFVAFTVGLVSIWGTAPVRSELALLNVSYDPTRELYQEVNAEFAKAWKSRTGQDVIIRQSHGGAGKQARSVIDGLQADVVTLALPTDIDEIARISGRVAPDWQKRLPHNACPYNSTIVFLVRKGNPKGIKDWDDVTRPGISVTTPNPKTSGGARLNYLAAWGYELKRTNDPAKARDFVTRLFKNVPVLDSGARGATTTFVQRGIGDVLLTWENEAFLAVRELGKDKLDIVTPSISILAEPPVAVVDKVVDKKRTRELAAAYLEFLYTPAGQRLVAKHGYRPIAPEIAAEYEKQFPKLKLITAEELGGWQKLHKEHFAERGIFDQIYRPGR